MHFKKLRLSGFKSFVRPTELLIEPGLTGIVGPNGCGKSNLVEALRWVMGESSARGLRGGEMDDVIFAGTAGRPAFDLAEVSLQLQSQGDRLPGFEDEDELELIRRIGRGAGSSFRLNGRELRARDVQLLFADAASGARSASIVSQGQIGALVEAKPQDRRRLLEEAAGTAGLQARRHEAELKLRATEANLVRLEDLLRTLEDQHEQLKKQARHAKRYGEIGARLREVEARLAAGRWLRAAAELEDARERLATAERDALALARDQEQLREARSQAAAELTALRDRAAALRTERARLAERVSAAELARDERRARLARSQEQVAQLERDRADARALLEDAQAAHDRLEQERLELVPALAQLSERVAQAAEKVDRLAGETEAAAREHRAALARHGELEAGQRHGVEERARLDDERRALELRASELAPPARALEPTLADGPDLAVAEQALARAEAAALEAELEAEQREQAREAAREALRLAAERLRAADQALRDVAERAARERQARESLDGRKKDLEQRLERLTVRRAELEARRGERLTAVAALGLDRLEEACNAAAGERTAAGEAEEAARAALGAAQEAGEAAANAARELASEIERLEVEAAALAEIGGVADHPAVVERIEVPDHLADALAAGLGDDLLASLDGDAPVRWAGAATPANLRLPGAARPLAELIGVPDALLPRLRQIGLCDGAEAAALQPHLAPGQRLVSAEGDLWRWDGFTRRADALQSVAARLRQSQRRREVESALGTLRDRLETALAEQGATAAVIAEAEATLASLVDRSTAAAARLAAAERHLAEARSAERSLNVELAGLAESLAGIDDEIDELRAALADVLAELRGAGAPAARDQTDLRSEHIEAENAHGRAFAAERMAAERLGEARSLVGERRADLERRRAEAERARTAEADARELRHAKERHAAELERLDGERTALELRSSALDARLDQLAHESELARAALGAAEAALARTDSARAAAVAERFALDGQHQAAEQRLARVLQDLELWAGRRSEAGKRVTDVEAREAGAREELRAVAAAIEPDDGRAEPLRLELEALDRRAEEADAALALAEQTLVGLEREREAAESGRAIARERVVRLEAEVERAEAALIEAEAGLRARPLPKDLEGLDELPEPAALAALDEERTKLELARERLGAVNLRAVDELRELQLRLETLSAERDELGEAIQRLRRAIGALNREGRDRLKAAFAEIEKHFEALFVRLFGGGQARLSLTDLEDPLAAGLELAASPPGKKLQSLSLLSGGEKALTALALIFAVFLSRPSPLCILDEVDAPLDDANVERLAALLDELAAGTETRFILITHHPLTMAHMDRLYGVTMLERGVSELVSVDLSRAVELRQTA